ncbi:nitroreductase family deazaflavin-dependent oxidoreductase [Gordonia hankookensis]|uniref:Nitroreductase family deazaflavin-dependent oxidoreductase n=1 Tax=Gordonia hankookensis TaxID=589403 RepID=A0ABR7WHU9_9ACTN|nr:nitroreductase family deazaflavin-dependent oxidoreductase [Gordonia hankookensis]MBD1322338.1 nitroreductase family deazaflavin-dependent oxidoreductase [Gordonia hankookensis]
MSIAARLLQTRWFVRAPIIVFRARLGFLFGGRLLLLEHTGRRTGEKRYVVLETVERASPTQVVIASGFGTRAQWFKNLQADPRCRVSVGWSSRRAALAEVLGTDDATAVLDRYRDAHARAYAELSGVIEESTGLSIDDVPLVRLTLI